MATLMKCPGCGSPVTTQGEAGPDNSMWHPRCLRSASRAGKNGLETTIAELEQTKEDLLAKIESQKNN